VWLKNAKTLERRHQGNARRLLTQAERLHNDSYIIYKLATIKTIETEKEKCSGVGQASKKGVGTFLSARLPSFFWRKHWC
jgi:hypothetical protein